MLRVYAAAGAALIPQSPTQPVPFQTRMPPSNKHIAHIAHIDIAAYVHQMHIKCT